MHFCPDCGQACFCHGDIDDCEVETPEYSAAHCTHECDDYEDERDNWDDDWIDEGGEG